MKHPAIHTLLGLVLLSSAWLALPEARAQQIDEPAAQRQYASALNYIENGRYMKALSSLRQLQRQFPTFSKMSAVQTRIAVLQESADAGNSLAVFLSALTLRDQGDVEAALQALYAISTADPAGALTDDALYVTAYMEVMDRYDFRAARVALSMLESRFPESAYSDSAEYLDAIALEQLGETEAARARLIALRDRHTALNLPMKFRWPKGSVLSRYWFDRADRRLAIVEERIASASKLSSRTRQSDGKLRVAVSLDGTDLQLLLVPSPLTRQTQWLDGALSSQLPPAIGIYDGVVEGVTDSWVRVVLQQNSLTGVLYMDDTQHTLKPDNLIGTLDYYQPRSKKPNAARMSDSSLAQSLQGLDALVAPPVDGQLSPNRRARGVQTDVRAVPVSIVVDSQYDRYFAGGGLAVALNNLNVADGVYRQFGLALSLDEAITFTDKQDPMNLGAVTLETILRAFRDYRLQYKTLFNDSALTYLFTGNPRTDITLGLAWIDTACRVDGYDVGVTTPSTFGDVLLTHELGHSLGAKHDTDTQCNDNSLSLMWPNISERTESRFSSCSKASVLGSRTKACLLNSVNLTLKADSDGTRVSFRITNPDSALTLDTQMEVETSAPDQLIWPAGCQVQTPTSALCYVDAVEPASDRTLSFAVSEAFQGVDAPVTAQVRAPGVLELQPSDNLATASLAGGTSNKHLIVNSNKKEEAGGNAGGSPSAAKSGSGALHPMWGLLLLAVCLVRGRAIGKRLQSDGVEAGTR